MAKTKISEYDATAANNTDIDSINIAEGMAPSNVNNAIRELMAHLKDGLGAGTPVYLDATNNRVGIGETSPDSDLHISSTANPTISIEDTDNGFAATTLKVENGGRDLDITVPQDMIFTSGSTEAMRILSGGNVGIGTSSPSAKLEVAGSSNSTYLIAGGDDGSNGRGLTFTSSASASFNGAVHTINAPSSQGVIALSTYSAERMRIDANGNLAFNRTSANFTSGYGIHLHDNRFVGFGAGGNGRPDFQIGTVSGTSLEFRCGNGADTADISIDPNGRLLIGTTSTDLVNNNGVVAYESGLLDAGRDSLVGRFTRRTTDGNIVEFRKDGTTVGSIGNSGNSVVLNSTGDGVLAKGGTDCLLWTTVSLYPKTDNALDLGLSIRRYDDVYATNGTIQTSDQNEKQQIASLTDAEMTAAKAISKLFKTFKWNDSVAEKGDAARTHTGVIAQEVEQAMTDAGLNAGDYAFFISTTWWETQTEVPAVEAVDEVLDEDGNVITEAVEGKEAYTRTDTYDTLEEAPEGATERNRKGIRYPQLLSFIGAATEQRLASIESRLDALESA